MRKLIREEIKRLCRKAFAKMRSSELKDNKYKEKFTRRTGQPALESWPRGPTYSHRHFDPWHCKRNANALATAIWKKVLSFDYAPTPAVRYQIPKPGGGHREIMAFSIPDAALANVVMRAARGRNLKRLSPYSYAYHPDKNVFDAILSLKDYVPDGKLFSVQIDFEKYFDSIPTGYIQEKTDDESIVSLTPHERYVFGKFLRHLHGEKSSFWMGEFDRRFKGTPQGSSVSLFMANLANHELDGALAREAGKFVRFADDVVAFCDRYEDAQRLERCFERHCEASGLLINKQKSPGVAIISQKEQEMRTIFEFKYLGYSFSHKGLVLPISTVQKLKQKISRLINIYLINYLKHGHNASRASRTDSYDWELLGLISEIRRSLYGGLSESEISAFLNRESRLRGMRGLMGFYSLLEDSERLKELDGWLVNTLRRAMVHRRNILMTVHGADCPTPSNIELISGSWLNMAAWRAAGDPPETSLPSFVRGWRAARKHFLTFGLEGVEAPSYPNYNDLADLFDFSGY